MQSTEIFFFLFGVLIGLMLFVIPWNQHIDHVSPVYVKGHVCFYGDWIFKDHFDFNGHWVKDRKICYEIMNYTGLFDLPSNITGKVSGKVN